VGPPILTPSVCQLESAVAIGTARLSNRGALERLTGISEPGSSDLSVLTRLLLLDGLSALRVAVGEFSFALWNPCERRLTAARDALGVQCLFYRRRVDAIAVSSHASVLSGENSYDEQYLIEVLSTHVPSRGRTVFRSVEIVPPAARGGQSLGAITLLSLRRSTRP
jgi:asparagine synthetase B (glutamine-hydrolysing)